MRRLLIVLAAVSVMISLFGCSNLFDSKNNNSNNSKVEETLKVSPTVRILVEGEDLIGPSGQPYGELSRVDLDDSILSQSAKKETITLYFGDSEAEFVVPEKREVELEAGKSIEEVVMKELIKGPEKAGIDSVIPEGTRLISVETKDGICNLNLSKEFIDNNYTGSAGETMTVYSVVNSLTELPGVNKVQFLIEGEKREVYLHMAFDAPIGRDENIIKK